jgi:hypothetical protein
VAGGQADSLRQAYAQTMMRANGYWQPATSGTASSVLYYNASTNGYSTTWPNVVMTTNSSLVHSYWLTATS